MGQFDEWLKGIAPELSPEEEPHITLPPKESFPEINRGKRGYSFYPKKYPELLFGDDSVFVARYVHSDGRVIDVTEIDPQTKIARALGAPTPYISLADMEKDLKWSRIDPPLK